MKKLLALMLLCSLLVGCTYPAPPEPVEPQVQEDNVLPATDTSLLCMAYNGTEDAAKLIATYYDLGANCLKVHQSGTPVKEEGRASGRTCIIGNKNYPVYYSVTTRSPDELNEVDAYTNMEGTITVNYLKDTDQISMLSFTNLEDGPALEGGTSKETVIAFAKANLPSDFDIEKYKVDYQGDELLGGLLTLTRQIAEYNTVETITFLFSDQATLIEMRLQNYGKMKDADVEYALVSGDKLVADVTALLKEAYLESNTVAIDSVNVSNVILGIDLNGEAYYNVTADVTYQDATDAPTQLPLIYYPSRLV